ncbi:MAG TPA: oligosaccharide flippase family protein [Geminicoccaceae bacterium]|nr:oligosaccharide flippase family protein [Geminicoccaceae bacterium]
MSIRLREAAGSAPPDRPPLAGTTPPKRALAPLLALGGSRAVAAGLSALAVLAAARLAAPAELGLWSLALAVQGYALHASELGLRSVVTAESARTAGGAGALLAGYLRLRLGLAALVYGALILATWWLRPDQLGLVALTAASIFIVAAQLDWIPLTRGRAGEAGLLLLVRPLAFLACVVAWPGSLDALTLASLFLLSWLAAALASWAVAAAVEPSPPAAGAPPLAAREMLALGWPLALVTLSSQLVLSADLLLVGARFGAEVAGRYYLAAGIATAMLVLANAKGQIALAGMAPLRDRPAAFAAELAREARRIAWLAVLLALAAGALGSALVPFLFGAPYAPAASVLLWLAPWLLLQHVTTLLQGALTAARCQRRVLAANLLMAPPLALALLGAWTIRGLWAMALARALAEAVRLAALVALAPHGLARDVPAAVAPPLAVGLLGWLALRLLLP